MLKAPTVCLTLLSVCLYLNASSSLAIEGGGPSPSSLNKALTYKIDPFDQIKWESANRHTREGMVADLVHTRALIGMDEQEIHRLLGEPDRDGLAKIGSGKNVESYEMSSPKCGNAPVEFLDLRFGGKEVEKFRVRLILRDSDQPEVRTGQWISENLKW